MGLRDRFPRRPRVPADVADHLGLEPGERVLAAATLDDGVTAAASSDRLLLADGSGRSAAVPWHEVDTATWEPDGRVVDVRLVDGRVLRLAILGDTRTLLPETLRERVQSSVVLSRTVKVRGRRGVRVVVRRTQVGLVTQVLPDPGIALDDPDLAAEVDAVRREVEAAVGLAP